VTAVMFQASLLPPQAHRTCLLRALPLELVREGLALVPGLWRELERFSTDHKLWSWRKGETKQGRPTRILMPCKGV